MSQTIKKTIVLNKDLPSIIVEKSGYFFRYRIISEDKNRVSHWSNSVILDPGYTIVPGVASINKQSSTVSIVWDSVQVKKGTENIYKPTEYDLWAKWGKSDLGDWEYVDRIAGTTTTLNIPSTYFIDGEDQEELPNQLSIEIYLKGVPVSRDFALLRAYSVGPEAV